MNENTVRNVGALAAAALIVLAALSMPVLADAPSIDTETNNTTTTSELQDGTTIDNFTADSGTNSTLSTYDDDNVSRVVEVIDDGYTLDTLAENGTYVAENTSNVTRYFYNRSISHDVFEYAEVTAGEQHNVSLEIYNTSDSSELSSNNTSAANISVTLNASDGRTIRRLGEDDIDTKTTDPTFGESQTITSVDERTTTVTFSVMNGTAQDSLSAPTSDLSEDSWSGGATILVGSDSQEKNPVRYFSADTVPDGVEGTYAVWDSDSNDLRVELGENYADASDVEVEISSRKLGLSGAAVLGGFDGYSIWDIQNVGITETIQEAIR
jgi:hypothetical protein